MQNKYRGVSQKPPSNFKLNLFHKNNGKRKIMSNTLWKSFRIQYSVVFFPIHSCFIYCEYMRQQWCGIKSCFSLFLPFLTRLDFLSVGSFIDFHLLKSSLKHKKLEWNLKENSRKSSKSKLKISVGKNFSRVFKRHVSKA
jgi:hypothetical protein